jgi:hypothetical protein
LRTAVAKNGARHIPKTSDRALHEGWLISRLLFHVGPPVDLQNLGKKKVFPPI